MFKIIYKYISKNHTQVFWVHNFMLTCPLVIPPPLSNSPPVYKPFESSLPSHFPSSSPYLVLWSAQLLCQNIPPRFRYLLRSAVPWVRLTLLHCSTLVEFFAQCDSSQPWLHIWITGIYSKLIGLGCSLAIKTPSYYPKVYQNWQPPNTSLSLWRCNSWFCSSWYIVLT